MRELTTAACLLLALTACDPSDDGHDPIPEPSSSRELVIEQRTLPHDTTLTAVGLRPDDPSERADARWGYDCEYSRPISTENGWKQRFRVTVQNIDTDAIELEVSIAQYAAEGDAPPRIRQIGRVVVPPLTEKRFSGFMLNPRKPGEKLCSVELVDRS